VILMATVRIEARVARLVDLPHAACAEAERIS
jgi:hypothetical protein